MKTTAVLAAVAVMSVMARDRADQTTGQANAPNPKPAPLIASFSAAMISAPPADLGLDPFYRKYADAFGIPVVSSEKVPHDALLVARDIVNFMLLKRPDVREVMVGRKSRLLIMAESEYETDLPERRDWKKPAKDDPRLTPGERQRYDEPGGIASMTDGA